MAYFLLLWTETPTCLTSYMWLHSSVRSSIELVSRRQGFESHLSLSFSGFFSCNYLNYSLPRRINCILFIISNSKQFIPYDWFIKKNITKTTENEKLQLKKMLRNQNIHHNSRQAIINLFLPVDQLHFLHHLMCCYHHSQIPHHCLEQIGC